MGDIKSAREIAMEKIYKLGEPTEEERLEWKYLPEGEKLAARYLKQETDLPGELKQFDKKAAPFVIEGINSVLIKNLILPENEAAKKLGKRAMDGIKATKTDKSHTDAALKQIAHVFDHYEQQGAQQRKQAYEALKVDFQAKVEQALKQQMGSNSTGMRIDVEKQPQFLEEWRKLKAQLDAQYIQILTQYKEELEALV
jgi:plasmid stabilization system protein ParE